MSAIEESVKLGFLDNINIKPTISTSIYRTRQAILDNSDLIESLSSFEKDEKDALDRYTLSRMQTEEIMESVKSFYADSGIDPREESTRIEFANLLAMEHPEYSAQFFYDNLNSFIRQATGYDLNVESYWKDLGNIFQSSALSYLSSMEMALTMIFNRSNKENLMNDISRRATAYRRDLSSEDYNILQNMLASSVAQAPHLVADLGISAVGSLVGLPPGAMTALRVATAGLMEGGSSMLELAQAGADDTTILTTGIAVGVINGAFEVFGDNAILAPYQRLLKRNPTVKEAARYTWKTVGKQVAKDVVKGLVTEIPTEIAQEAVSMVGWNFATAFEQRYGRMQDALGYDKSQFVSALWEVAKETALSTPMITLSGDVMNYGTSYLNGQWRSQINASNVTRATENSQMFRSKDINVGNGEMSYISNRRDFKQEKADPIQLARIGDKLYAINPTDKQKSALKASKTVNAEIADFSATRLADPRNAEVTDIGITYDKAIESIQEGFEKGMVAGYSLLDENLNETNARDNAKYIEVVTNSAKDTAAVITLGKDEDSQSSFEKKVFGKVFHNISNQQESKADNKTSKRYEEYRKSKEQQKAQEGTQEAAQQSTQENTQSTTQEATQEASQATSQENAQQTVQETQQATQEEIKVSPAEETRDEKVAKANEKENSLAETLEKTVPNNVDEVVQIRDSIVSNGASLEDANAAAISIANSSATTGKTIEETVKDISTDISELSRAFTAKDISSREAIIDKIASQAKSLPKKAKEKIRSAYGVDRISKAIPSLKKDLESYLSTGKAKKGLGDIFSRMERIIENTMGYSSPTEQTVDTEQRVGERLSKAEKSDTPNETLVKETKKAKEKPAETAEYGTNADLKGKDRIGLNENGSPNISLLSNTAMDEEDFYKDVAKQFYDTRTNPLIKALKQKKELINQGLVNGDKIGKHIEDALSELDTIFNTLKYFDFEIKDVVPHYTKLKNALEALHQSLNKGDTLESLTNAKGIQDIYDMIGAITKLRDDPYGFGEQLGFKDSTIRKNLARAIKSIKKFITQTNDDITKGLYKESNDRLNKALTELSNGLEEMLSNINDKEKLKTFDYNDLANRFGSLVDSITSAQLNDKDNNTLKDRLDAIQAINGEFLAALKKVEDKYGQNAKTESSSETKTDDKTSNGTDNSKANAIDNNNSSEIGILNEEINKKEREIEALKEEYRTNTEMPYERYQEIIDTWKQLGNEIAQNEAEIARLKSVEEKSKASAELDTTKTAIASHDEAISKISESLDTGNKELDERNKETVRKLEEERETLLSESEKNATIEKGEDNGSEATVREGQADGRGDNLSSDKQQQEPAEQAQGRVLDAERLSRRTVPKGEDNGRHNREILVENALKSVSKDAKYVKFRQLDNTTEGSKFYNAIKEARESNKHGLYVTLYDEADYTSGKMKLFLNEDGTAGFAIKEDGDIVSVFKSSKNKQPKVVYSILMQAIENGGTKLDCYGDFLLGTYMQMGFVPEGKVAYNTEYESAEWTAKKDLLGEPDVYALHWGDKSADETASKLESRLSQFTKEEVAKTSDSLKLFEDETTNGKTIYGYDKLMEARDKSIEKKNSVSNTLIDLQRKLSSARSEEEISSAKSAIKAFGDKAYLDLKESERRLNKGAMKAIRKLYDTEKSNPFGLVKNDMKISKYVHQFERILEQYPNARTEDAFNMFSKVIFERLSQAAGKLNSEYETIAEKDLKTIVREYVDSIYALHAIYENKDYLFEDSAPIDRKIQILKNLMGEGLQDYSLSSLFDTSGIKMDETMEDILADNVRARYDKLIEKAQNGDSNVRFQEALNAESVMDGSDFSPFYEPYVYQKDGLYRFDQDLLAKEITRQTEGSIGNRKAKYIARLISMMPKKDIDAIIRKNGGRLILNATEAGIDIGDHRGASILTSAQIVLSRNSDATTVIHESFHVLTEIDQDLKANIWNAFKSTLESDKEKEQLREFIGENREIFGHDADTIMDRLSLLGKETLTETESQNLDEAITSAYEAWFRSNATSRLSSSIREAFRKVAELFSEVYRTVTGKALLPETIDEAFGATLEEAEEQGKKVRFQSNKAKTVSEMILDEATRDRGLDIATNIMLSKVSSEISTMLKGGDPRGISESIMGNQKVASYLESLTPEVRVLASEALQKRIAYIAQSPTVFARAFNEKIKKLETSIKRNYKWAMPTEAKEVLDVIADLWNNVRLKSSKPGYVYSSDNSQDIGIRRMVSITYDGMNVGELYDGLVESQKARGAVERSFTPREVVAMARALVNKDGSVRLDTNEENNVISLDGKYRAPLITMLNYKVTDKTRIAELNSSSFLDKAYIDMTNILITAMQSPEVTEQFVVDQNAVDVAKFLDSAGIENWVDIIADSDEGMEIAANIADLFDEKLRQIARKISKIRKDNSSTTTNIDEMLSRLDQIKKDLASRERANENVELLRKEIRNVRKRLTEEIERNAGLEAMRKDVESGDAYKSLKDEISALKNILKETRKKATQLENGFDPRVAKLEEEISLLKNTEAYKAIMQMKMTSDAYISKMENASKGGDARIAHDLADLLSAFRKKGSKDKPRLFDIGRYASNETYFGLLDFFLDKGMASEITLDDGSKAYAIEKTVRMLSLEEMAELTDLFENAKKQGEAIQAHKKKEREAEQRKKETLIINSLKGLSKMSESQRQRFIDAYMASIRPGSETYDSQNKRNLIQKTMPGFVLTTKLVKHLSPALYSYMFGGVMDGEYNSVNLNSQSNKEAENVRNRTRSFISMLSSTFGVEEKNVGYAMKKLFKKELNSIGIVDADSFLDNSKDERLKALKYYKNALESEKKKLSRNIANLEVLLSESVDENDAMSISTMIDNANARIAQINETIGDGTSSNAQYNMEQLMGIYIYAQSNDGISRLLKSDKEDVITQNLSLQNVAYVMDRFINDPGMAQYRKTAEWIMQDVGSRYDEMAEVYYQAENKVLKKEDMYFPISSMEGIYEKGDSMQLASLFSSDRGFVNDRDTKERTGARNALNLNVVDSYMSAVKRQEHYIAFKLLTDEMTPILSKDGQVARAIMAMYQEKSGKGQETVNQLYDYLETIKGKRGNYNDMNSIVSKIRNNFVVAKLWGNLSTVLQQFPTYLLVARHVGWKNAAIYLADYIGNGKNRSEMIYRLSPQMRDRARLDIETYKAGRDNAVSSLERWVESKAGRDLLGDAKVGYRRFIDFGISLMEKTDTAVANAMWWAVYNENIEEYSKTPDKYMIADSSGNRVSILEQAAADAATQAVMDLSPNSNPKDNSLIYSNADALWKQLLLFTNQLNKQFNMVYGDIMDLEFSEDYKEAMMPILRDLAVLGVVSMGAALISGNPWPEEDDEPEAFLAELAGYTLAEMVGNAPILGTAAKDLVTGSTYAETNLLKELYNLQKVALKDPDKRTKHQMSRAVVNTFAETGTLFGVPTTAVQKSYRAIVESMDNPSIGNLGYLINTKQGKFFGRIME